MVSVPGSHRAWHWVPYTAPMVGTLAFRAPCCGQLAQLPANPVVSGQALPVCAAAPTAVPMGAVR